MSKFDDSDFKTIETKSSFDDSDFQPIKKSETLPTSIDSSKAQTAQETKDLGAPRVLVKNIVQGLGDAALELGDLAADVLSNINATEGVGKGLKSVIKKGQEANQMSQEEFAQHPYASSLGRGIGSTAGMIVGPTKIVRGAEAIAKSSPLVRAGAEAIPNWLGGAAREGMTGALQGAALQPEDRGQGAVIGGLVGAPLGALGGIVSGGLQQGARQIAPEIQRMKDLGIDVSSPQALARIRQELASRGQSQLQEQMQAGITKKTEQEITKIRPTYVPDEAPNKVISNKITQRFPEVERQKNANYLPLNESTGQINTSEINSEIHSLSTKTKSFIPDDLPADATFSELQSYRQQLSGNLKAAQTASKMGNLSPKELPKLYGLKTAVSRKMQEVAESQGLGEQFNQAETFYLTQYKPFETFSKSGKINTPQTTDQVWDKVNTIMNTKTPKIKQLKDLVTTLGDEGRDIVGWGLIQNALTAARSGDEIALPSFNAIINKYKVSGLGDIVYTTEHQQAIRGINKIIQDGKKALDIKTNRLYLPIISPVVEHLMQTQSGINLITKLGTMDRKSVSYRQALQNLLTGAVNTPINRSMDPSPSKLVPPNAS